MFIYYYYLHYTTALILHGLDALTTEKRIFSSLSQISEIRPKTVFVVRNPLTGLSRGYAVVECHSLRDSTNLLLSLREPFEVDGKAISAGYCKSTYPELLVQVLFIYLTLFKLHFYLCSLISLTVNEKMLFSIGRAFVPF